MITDQRLYKTFYASRISEPTISFFSAARPLLGRRSGNRPGVGGRGRRRGDGRGPLALDEARRGPSRRELGLAARALRDLINFLPFAGFFVVDQSGQRGVHVWVILDALGAGARRPRGKCSGRIACTFGTCQYVCARPPVAREWPPRKVCTGVPQTTNSSFLGRSQTRGQAR